MKLPPTLRTKAVEFLTIHLNGNAEQAAAKVDALCDANLLGWTGSGFTLNRTSRQLLDICPALLDQEALQTASRNGDMGARNLMLDAAIARERRRASIPELDHPGRLTRENVAALFDAELQKLGLS